tara:strand:- start:620 stop:1015 length:396 start_codon:yes stop_codon:yes gene_type:complete
MILGKIKILFTTIAITSLVSVFAYQWWALNSLRGEIIILRANNGNLKTAVQQQNKTSAFLQEGLSRAISSGRELASEIADEETRHQEIRHKIDNYRGRLHNVALKKPKTIQSYTNRSIADVLREFDRATGN